MNLSQPLAERMRPKELDEFVGQERLDGMSGPLRKIIEGGTDKSYGIYVAKMD